VLPSDIHRLLDRSWLCLPAGAMMAFAYAPFGYYGLVFLLLQPLLVAARHHDANVRIWRGLLFGIGYFPIGAYWFAETLRDHLGYDWPLALGGHLMITGACALAPCIFCWLAGYLRASGLRWVLLVSALWVVVEDIRFQAFGGGPWMSLGLSQVDSPLAGYYALVGEIGSSFFVCLIAGLIWILATNVDKRRRIVSGGVIALTVAGGAWLHSINWTKAIGDPQSLALVQTAVSQEEKQDRSSEAERLNELADLSRPYLGSANLIIWPETVVTLDRQDVDSVLASLGQEAMFARSTLLLGAYEPGLSGKRFNTAFTLGFEGEQTYRKRHLVPFGEYVPGYLSFLNGHVPGDEYRSLGRTAKLIANSGVLYGVSICWEGSFSRDMSPLVRSGAHVLVNIANEAWFAGSTLPPQNLDAMRVRAMETGRETVRVANFGPGAILSSKGEIVYKLSSDKADSVQGMIQPRTGLTPFVVLGEDLITLVAVFVLVGFVWRMRVTEPK